VTSTPAPARVVIPSIGVTSPATVVAPEPPSTTCAPSPASAPITAIDPTRPASSGSTPPASFSSTLPCSAIRRASATCAGVLTTAEGSPLTGWSNSPTRNIATRMRRTMSSSRAIGTWPDCTAALSGSPKWVPSGISMSMPALAASTASRVAKIQSETTKPSKPQSESSVASRSGFWQA
jgi:hypothetical protein